MPYLSWESCKRKYHAKGKKLYTCFMDLKKDFDRVPRKVLERTMRKNGIQGVLVRLVTSLYKGALTRVTVNSEFSE